MSRARALLRRVADQRGFTITELVVVMAILSTVVTSLTGLMVSGTKSSLDLSGRVEAQNNAVTALSRMRRDVNCASSATASSASSVTLAVPCVSGGVVSWCAVSVSTGRYALYRRPATGTCGNTNALYADWLTTNSLFAYQASSVDSLAKLKVTLPVQTTKMKSPYTLCDLLVMRNSTRTGSGSAVSPC